MDWLKKAPTTVVIAVVVVCGVITLGVLGAFVLLSLQGVDTTDLRQWIQTLGITVILPLLGINTIASVASAKSSSATEDQANSHLDDKDRTIEALRAQLRQREDRRPR